MPQTPPIDLLEQFEQELQSANIGLDVTTRLRLRATWKAFVVGGTPLEDLGEYLSPIVVKDAEEQQKFDAVWKGFLAKIKQGGGGGGTGGGGGGGNEQPPSFWQRLKGILQKAAKTFKRFPILPRRLVLWLILGIGLFLGWVYLWPLEVGEFRIGWQSPNKIFFEVGDTLRLAVRNVSDIEDLHFKWSIGEVIQPETDSAIVITFSEEKSYSVKVIGTRRRLWHIRSDSHWTNIPVYCRGIPNWGTAIPVIDSLNVNFSANPYLPNDTVPTSVLWTFANRDTVYGRTVTYTFDSAGTYPYKVFVTNQDFPNCPRTDSGNVTVPKDSIIKRATFPPLTKLGDQSKYTKTITWPARILLPLLAGLLIGGGLFLYYERKRRKTKHRREGFEEKLQHRSNGPYHIPWPDQDHLILWDQDLDRVAALMASRRTGDQLRLDIPQSIQATIGAGGFTQLAYKGQSQLRRWLILVDEGSLNTQELRLLAWWTKRLRSETVSFEEYHFRDRPFNCWRVGSELTLPLHQLQALYPQHLLIVVGRGDGLLHPIRNQILRPLHDTLRLWQNRVFLTPELPHAWRSKEQALAELFGVCPLNSKAMLTFFMLPSIPDGIDHAQWKARLCKMLPPPMAVPKRATSFEDYGKFARWAKALHTYPEPVWELTLAMGSILGPQPKELNWDQIWEFLRLPFNREGRLNGSLRRGIAALRLDEAVLTGRTIVRDQLVKATGTLKQQGQEGFASSQAEFELAVQNYAIDPHHTDHQAAMRVLEKENKVKDVSPPLPDEPTVVRGKKLALAAGLFVIAAMFAVLFLIKSDVPKENRSVSAIMKLESIPNRNAYQAWHDSIVEYYEEADSLFLDSSYTDAIERLDLGIAQYERRGPGILYDVATSKAYRDTLLPACLMNGLGLCYYYDGLRDEAIKFRDSLLALFPAFFEEIAVDEPNLRSLLNGNPDIWGKVVDDQGQPVAGAKIEFLIEEEYFKVAESKVLGEFEVWGDFAPSTPIKISLPGYLPWNGEVEDGKNIKAILEPEPCPNKFTITAAVQDGQGRAVAPTRAFGPRGSKIRRTNNTLRMEVCGVTGDSISVSVFADGYARLDTILKLRCNRTTPPFVMSGVKLKMRSSDKFKLPILSGKVYNEAGQEITDYEIKISYSFSNEMRKSTDGSFKMFVLEDLGSNSPPQEEVMVIVRAKGYRQLGKKIVLPAYDQRFVLKDSLPENTWPVTVVDENGQPVQDFIVFVDAKRYFTATEKDKGKVSLPTSIVNGKNQVKIRAQGFLDKDIYPQDFIKEIKMQWDPEIKKLIGDMVFVKGDTFAMGFDDGSQDQKPRHGVILSNFRIGKFEVTQGQWLAVIGNNPSSHQNCDDCPVEQVSWDDCQLFIQKLNMITRQEYRLPSEAEWEFAAHGGINFQDFRYSGSDDLNEVGWFGENSGGQSHPIGMKSPNGLSLYDMSGNVWEWCQDWLAVYPTGIVVDPRGPISGKDRVLRGGCWVHPNDFSQIDSRYANTRNFRNNDIGFRLARD
jgi:formylglycine-generating enzyme required for sulfatase activity/tetratricopeptide (TPR) repeat protein